MAAYIRQRPASWFWLVGKLITFWGLVGLAAWVRVRFGWPPETPGAPGWAFALAAGAVLGGGVALLLKKRIARVLFIVALAAAAVQLGWLLVAGDVPARLETARAMLAASVVAGSALLVWFASYSRRHGWIM